MSDDQPPDEELRELLDADPQHAEWLESIGRDAYGTECFCPPPLPDTRSSIDQFRRMHSK